MKKYAICIGVQDYGPRSGVSELRFARRDAVELGKVLRDVCTFDEVVVMVEDDGYPNPTASRIIDELEDARRELGSDDLLFFYFAGHGIEKEVAGTTRSYLLPTEASVRRPRSWLELAELKEAFGHLKADRRIILLDCCRNDPEAGKGDADNRLSESMLTRDILPAARASDRVATTILMTACSPGERAYEWPTKEHGVFTWYLLEAIREAAWQDNQLVMQDVCNYVQTQTLNWSTGPQRQKPYFQQFEGSAPAIIGERANESFGNVSEPETEQHASFHLKYVVLTILVVSVISGVIAVQWYRQGVYHDGLEEAMALASDFELELAAKQFYEATAMSAVYRDRTLEGSVFNVIEVARERKKIAVARLLKPEGRPMNLVGEVLPEDLSSQSRDLPVITGIPGVEGYEVGDQIEHPLMDAALRFLHIVHTHPQGHYLAVRMIQFDTYHDGLRVYLGSNNVYKIREDALLRLPREGLEAAVDRALTTIEYRARSDQSTQVIDVSSQRVLVQP